LSLLAPRTANLPKGSLPGCKLQLRRNIAWQTLHRLIVSKHSKVIFTVFCIYLADKKREG
jgi:hypothetical protein